MAYTNDIQGQTQVKTINLTNTKGDVTWELDDIFLGVSIYEDLFSPFKTGKLIIQDTNDLQVLFPIIGGETLDIEFFSNNDKRPKMHTFNIYKLEKDNRPVEKDISAKVVILYFCSAEMLIDTRASISKHFKGSPESVISSVLKKYLKSNKTFDAQSTNNEVDFVANFWTPSKIFQFLSRSSTSGNFSDYVFYEDRDGFNFKPISKLMEQVPEYDLEFRDELSSKHDFTKIQRYTMSKYFDLLLAGKNGGFGNTVFKFDNEKYLFTKEEEDFESITQYGTSLGMNVQFDEQFISNSGVITTFKDNRHIAKRDQFLKAMDKYHMVIHLTGDSKKTVGQVYNIIVPKQHRMSSEQNELLTGNWLVTNIKHEFASSGIYTQNIKCVKNAFFKSANTNKVKGKKNL